MEKGELSYPAGGNVNWGSRTENSMEVSQKNKKQSCHVTQQLHCWACIWRTLPKSTCTQGSLQHDSQQPRHRSSLRSR